MRHQSLEMFDAAQVAHIPTIADGVEEHFSMIELHRDHKSHMPKANRQRTGLIGVAGIDRLHFDHQT